jgi:hypothetical protein
MQSSWTVSTLNRTGDAEIEALPADMRVRLVRISNLIAAVGLQPIGLPHVTPVQMPLREIPLSGRLGLRERSM